MNRAEKAKEYLDKRLEDLKDFKDLMGAKPAFFDSVIHFKNTVIPDLRKFKIFAADDIDDVKELENILARIEPHRSQGGASPYVYETGVWPDYGAAQAQIYKLISIATTIKVPLRLKFWDLVSSKTFVIAFVVAMIVFTLQLVCR
jgi:hypothetical protein